MTKVRYRYFGLLLCTLIGFAMVTTPANAAAPSWISNGKYANYRGGFDIGLGTVRATALAAFNWTMSDTTPAQVTIDGGWNVSISLTVNDTLLGGVKFGTIGNETIQLSNSHISMMGGYDLFGLEQGPATVLWVEDTSVLSPTNASIGGRHCVTSSAVINLPLPYPMNLSGVQVIKYYDTETGVLMALNLALNITGLLGGMGGLGSLGLFSFPIVISSTNVVPYAWNLGGDAALWLEAVGVLLGVSVLFGLLVYAKKR